MAYEYESRLRNYLIGHKNVNPKFDGFEILKSLEEIKEVYRKAKILDEVKNFTTERLKEQKLTDEYDFGERLMCEEIEDIIGGQK